MAKKEIILTRCYDCANAYLMRKLNDPIIAGCPITHQRNVASTLFQCPHFDKRRHAPVINPLIKAK